MGPYIFAGALFGAGQLVAVVGVAVAWAALALAAWAGRAWREHDRRRRGLTPAQQWREEMDRRHWRPR